MLDDDIDQINRLHKLFDDHLTLSNPKSFFLYAGAGSGKTRSLIEAMEILRKRFGQDFNFTSRRIAVITYTNVACDEIKHRINYDSIFIVSTIHSFAWNLIQSFQKDIREWLRNKIARDIDELDELQRNGRMGTKAYFERSVQIESKKDRLKDLDIIKSFTYNPNGENSERNSLTHNEVIGIASSFISNKPLMQKMFIRKYPFLLVDESQDTQKDLIDAFLNIQHNFSKDFSLSLFGDTMQRIYSDGKVRLEEAIPNNENWEKPSITINHRCPKRIVKFINKIRADVDDHVQIARTDATEGFVRLFLIKDRSIINSKENEDKVAKKMSEITSDRMWSGDIQQIKILTLEHHMAARRGGFQEFFEPLYQIPSYRTGLLDGTLSGIPFLSKQIIPLVESLRTGNRFSVAQIIKSSPIIASEALKTCSSPITELKKTNDAVQSLFSLWQDGKDPILIDILMKIAELRLFNMPEIFTTIVTRRIAENKGKITEPEDASDINLNIDAWDKALSVPFTELEFYFKYISDQSPFATHQGIKGLQFPRVMVILDDNEARGWMFSYDKLFGAKSLTQGERKNEEDGKETSLDRTRRLFYVTCSRTQSSLAIVLYTNEISNVRDTMEKLEWLGDDEIIDM